jgi:hypothetical protein
LGIDLKVIRKIMHIDRGRMDKGWWVYESDPKQIDDIKIHEKIIKFEWLHKTDIIPIKK